ncbi:hypothetical protein [Cryptosporangium phraense]|uniref:Secreted protein n=1 Tax=Cryptosporangium phraense TaxID=2593070 RepID=A0A545AYD9_9ACTN|nr:hypothetical protein [Cryptosporangium phraense]TQS46323.1 hypothetical protein FL583_02715 [Cryptosporangium phraense]
MKARLVVLACAVAAGGVLAVGGAPAAAAPDTDWESLCGPNAVWDGRYYFRDPCDDPDNPYRNGGSGTSTETKPPATDQAPEGPRSRHGFPRRSSGRGRF